MIQYSKDMEGDLKHCLKQVGKKYIFSVKNLKAEDAGLYQMDVEGVNVLSTDFKRMYFTRILWVFANCMPT